MISEIVVIDNMGNRIEPSYFMKKESVALYDNMFGKDNNPATKALPDEKYCECCGKEDDDCLLCVGCRRVRYCGKECQAEHWNIHREHCKLCCEVIFTYSDKGETGQDVYNIYMKSNVDEPTFINNILDTVPMRAKNLHDLHHLVKLSVCVFVGKLEGAPVMTFRDKCNGKYFFYSGRWKKFLREYMSCR